MEIAISYLPRIYLLANKRELSKIRFKPNEPLASSKKRVSNPKANASRWDEALVPSTTSPTKRISLPESLALQREHISAQVSRNEKCVGVGANPTRFLLSTSTLFVS